ncbi:MAG: DUF4982 domain-containing protein [Lachnospiraceae bacterium]|nr:DUF4982 domain-containing protein [Lachnospiraceae bacterium]
MIREKFNSNWKVWKDMDPFELVFKVPGDAVCVDLPYDAMFHEEQKPDSVNGGSTGHIDAGEYKYYREFFVPAEEKGLRMVLQFEGIYRNALVFVNQSKVGESPYGYTDFSMDITDYIRYGEKNEILVLVKCGTRSSRWYSGAGIYRDVYLYKGAHIYVNPYGLRAATVDVDEDGALVSVTAQVHNDTLEAGTYDMTVAICDAEGNQVVNQTYPVRMRSREQMEFHRNFYISDAKLWDDRDPNLYTVQFTIADQSGILDENEITTGIRKLSLDAQHGLRVNGRTVKLRGACIHHDAGLLGACAYDDYEYRRVLRLKEAGFNAVHSAHNPASQALLRACDRLGMYVMDELVDVWNKSKVSYDYAVDFERCWESDIRHMVDADYNHPSVVLYSTGNEILEICTEKGFETCRMLGDKFHELDPSRYTTNGINGAFAAGDGLKTIVDDISGGTADTGSGDVNVFMAVMEKDMPAIVSHPVLGAILEKLDTAMDVMGYNYMTSRYLKDAETYPDRMMVGSETYPKQIAENWDAIMQCSQAIGDFTWTGWDYMGEVSPVYPDLMNTGGDISIIGNRRPVSYYREIVYGLTKKPCIAVQAPARFGTPRFFGPWCYTDCTFNYSYPGEEGKDIMIQVYAGGDQVELLQNGKSLGIQPCGKNTAFETQFNTTYEPGELVAVAYENGAEIGRTSLTTAGAPAGVKLSAERYGMLAFVNIDVLDAEGRLAAGAAIPLTIAVEGDAKLMGFGSAGAKHDHGYEKPDTTSADGHALAVLKMSEGCGEIRVVVSGENLASEEIVL